VEYTPHPALKGLSAINVKRIKIPGLQVHI